MEHEVLKPSSWLEFSLAQLNVLPFVVAPCMLLILSSLFVQLMHTIRIQLLNF